MPRSLPALAICQCLLLCSASSTGSLAASTCNLAEQPAATLLYPYFEVDVDDPGGRTTLLSIVNAETTTPTLAHVVLWTDWGIPSASFDLFLAPGDGAPTNLDLQNDKPTVLALREIADGLVTSENIDKIGKPEDLMDDLEGEEGINYPENE